MGALVAVSLAQRRLAAALKHLRARSGMSAAELGRAIGWNGGRRVSVAEATAWAEATNAPADLLAEVTELAESAVQDVRSWWNVHAEGMAGRQQEIAALEASAKVIRNTQHVIPGILQTAEYARHALELANVSGQSDVTTAVANRMRRQEALYDSARRWEYVLPEAALCARLSSDPVVTRAQADRLLSLDTLPNISIAVLPFSTPWPVWPAPFVLYEVPGEPLVVIEYLTGEVTIGEERQVAMYREAFTRLREAALTGEDAHHLIQEAMPQA
jgi:transcriptional regulator with XRE-family HTH domain